MRDMLMIYLFSVGLIVSLLKIWVFLLKNMVIMLTVLNIAFSLWIILKDSLRKFNVFLSYSHGLLPFNYLGVFIFVDAPKIRFLQPLADKVKLKLTSWKEKSLNMMDQIQLVNTVVTGFLVYSFSVYKWPASILKQVE